MRLIEYPFVVVRIACAWCSRSGSYRLARLAEKYGCMIGLDDMVDRLTHDCPHRDNDRVRLKKPPCEPRLIDLHPPRPPDLPPAMSGLTVIEGGMQDAAE